MLTIEIIVPPDNALHAYKPLLPAVKTGQPHFLACREIFLYNYKDR